MLILKKEISLVISEVTKGYEKTTVEGRKVIALAAKEI